MIPSRRLTSVASEQPHAVRLRDRIKRGRRGAYIPIKGFEAQSVLKGTFRRRVEPQSLMAFMASPITLP